MAHAVCASPSGNAGDIIYDPEFRNALYCNDTVWMPLLKMNYTGGYVPHALYFDGTDDYYTQGGAPVGVADGKTVTGTVWVRRKVTGTIDTIFAINDRFILRIASDGDVEIVAENTADTDILDMSTTSTPLNDTGWHFIAFSIDMANSANNVIAVDFTPQPLTYNINLDQNIDFSVSTYTLGASSTGTNKFDGYISEFWLEAGLFLDFNQLDPFFRFVDENGLPRYQGGNGAKAMGYAPDFYISGPFESQGINKGTAGGFAPAALALDRVGTPITLFGVGDGCPSVGDTCSDGSIFVGMSADDKQQMFAAAADLPGTYTWGNGSNSGASPLAGTLGTCFEDDDAGEGAACFTGQKNSEALAAETGGDAPYLAAQACEELTAHGYSDWYLPSQVELITLQENAGALGLANTDYWSSSEAHIAGDAHHITIPSGIWRAPIEDAKSVRCVRKFSCSAPYGRAGDIVYNDDARVMQICSNFLWVALGDVDPPGAETGCTSPAGTGGDVVFNSAAKVLQYCDGLNWHDMAGHILDCGSNAVVGQLCPDGSVYAGLSPDGNVPMYTTTASSAGTYTWNSNGGNTDTMIDCVSNPPGAQVTCRTGESNTNVLAGLADAGAPYPAANYCYDMVAHGRDDWYLPSSDELRVLYDNRTAIGGYANAYHWASSEYSSTQARILIHGGAGTDSFAAKFQSYNVRCVRK